HLIMDLNQVKQLLHQPRLIISGPCSAETREQIMGVGRALHATGRVHIFRAGIWKPRTRPGSFEGLGEKALPWLTELRQETGLPVTIEIARSQQVETALKYDIDFLWIGARTSVNPFSVQELADSLEGVQKPVFIKNPLNADIDLWTGAVERIRKSGIENIALIHRGFSRFGALKYRNEPLWSLVVEMRRRFPELPILCDSSHIAGNRNLLLEVSQKSLDLGYNGLMIETHPVPDEAWSDAQQQITPEQLVKLLDALSWRKEFTDKEEFNTALSELRSRIDAVDAEILELLAQRMRLADEIGENKKRNNITILQAKRWEEINERALAKCDTLNLSKRFIEDYFKAIHAESILHQNAVMNPKED